MPGLSAEIIAKAFTTRRLGHPVLYFGRVGSTNDVALEHAAAGAPEGLFVLADEQTSGRGRLDRTWWAPPGTSLLMSLLLRPPFSVRLAGQLPMCLGLAAIEGIEAVTGLRPALKWPNDLVWKGRKLGGMLTELRTSGERVDYAVLGLGLNVNVAFDDQVPGELAATAVSLLTALGKPVDRVTLLAAIIERCAERYERLLAGESLHEAWSDRLDTIGQQVVGALPSGPLQGTAAGVTAEGALILRLADGREELVWAGDITALHPVS
jgi:BirA family biotin operon repressor/biotin-[acetyl-CoA-carboxylase] ligase